MKTYNQFCPLAQAAQLLCERWTFIIIRELIAGSTRFSDLQKGVPKMSPTLLSSRLKQLVKANILELKGNHGNYTYNLTEAGKELRPMVELLGAWGHRWVPSDLGDDDLDAGLLMWDMRRTIDSSSFPKRRIVVQFEYSDAPEGANNWWLVSENGEIDLCLTDNGYDIDVLIKSSVTSMTKVWTCDVLFNDAVKEGDIKVYGSPELTSKLQSWIRVSALSSLGSQDLRPTIAWN